MWTSFKAFYLKKEPLDKLAELSNSMGELFQWKSSHFEDIPWISFDSNSISEALLVYSWNEVDIMKEEQNLKKKGRRVPIEDKKPKQPKITKGNLINILFFSFCFKH